MFAASPPRFHPLLGHVLGQVVVGGCFSAACWCMVRYRLPCRAMLHLIACDRAEVHVYEVYIVPGIQLWVLHSLVVPYRTILFLSLGMRRLSRLLTLVSHAGVAASRPTARDHSIGTALRAATANFVSHGVPEPSLSAEHLLARCAGFGNSRSALVIHAQEQLTDESRAKFDVMCARRLEREPIQYILGDWDFMDLTLNMRPPVLIPRPETEQLVELILGTGNDGHDNRVCGKRILDVGCGSGAIGLALLRRLPTAVCVGIDVSADATALAAHNAEQCELSERYTATLVEGGIKAYTPAGALYDVIVSNPPYIPRADYECLEPEVSLYEDERALCGGIDGLDVVRDVLRAAPRLLRPDGPRTIWLEIDPIQPPLIDAWLRSDAEDLQIELVCSTHDAYGRLRFCELRWVEPSP